MMMAWMIEHLVVYMYVYTVSISILSFVESEVRSGAF